MTLRLTWWEYEDLSNHLASRPDIWMQSEENSFLWLRTENDWSTEELVERPGCALLFHPPSSETSPYRLYQIEEIPMDWPPEYTASYVRKLLLDWTSYGRRVAVYEFLVETLKHDPETADLAAIAIEALDYNAPVPELRSEEDLPPGQARLYTDSIPPMLEPGLPDPSDIGTWLLRNDGGWIRLRLLGNQLRVFLSIRSSGTGGFGPNLEGYVRPVDGRVRDTAAFLAGWEKPSGTPRSDVPGKQLQLESIIPTSAEVSDDQQQQQQAYPTGSPEADPGA